MDEVGGGRRFWKVSALAWLMVLLRDPLGTCPRYPDPWFEADPRFLWVRKEVKAVCVCVYVCVCVRVCSVISDFVISWTVDHQASLSMGFSRQKYWSGLPFPTPGDLSNPGIEPVSLVSPALAAGFFTTCATWEEQYK